MSQNGGVVYEGIPGEAGNWKRSREPGRPDIASQGPPLVINSFSRNGPPGVGGITLHQGMGNDLFTRKTPQRQKATGWVLDIGNPDTQESRQEFRKVAWAQRLAMQPQYLLGWPSGLPLSLKEPQVRGDAAKPFASMCTHDTGRVSLTSHSHSEIVPEMCLSGRKLPRTRPVIVFNGTSLEIRKISGQRADGLRSTGLVGLFDFDFLKILFRVYRCFVCMCAHAPWTCLVPSEARGGC